MNKQALAFLTMFSLILMLSVYYVTLPSDTTSVMKETNSQQKEPSESKTDDTQAKGETKTATKEEGKDTSKVNEAKQLQEEIDRKKDSEINKNSAVVSDGEADEAAKQKALTTMEELKNDKDMQGQVAKALSKEKLNVAVELKDHTCIVNVFDKKDDKKLAASIMKTVSNLTKQKYFIEVTFK